MAISKHFQVTRFVSDAHLVFNRLHILQDADYNITVSMKEYLYTTFKLPLDRERRKVHTAKCSPDGIKSFQALAGQINWLGHGMLSPAIFVPSTMQKWACDLKAHHLNEANRALHDIRQLSPVLTYRLPSKLDVRDSKAAYLALSDASQL